MNTTLYDSILRITIASSMSGVTPLDIVGLVLARNIGESRLRAMNLDTVTMQYTVSVFNFRNTFSYATLTTQLKTAVLTGQFATNLQTRAVAAGAFGMTDTTSEDVTTVSTSPHEAANDEPVLSGGAIAGITVAIAAVVVGFVLVIYYLTVRKSNTGRLLHNNNYYLVLLVYY